MKLPERWQKTVNKTVNTMFNKVKENEKCVFYFYLKTERTFWPIYIFFLRTQDVDITLNRDLGSFSFFHKIYSFTVLSFS